MYDRLSAQCEEAKVLKLNKVASSVTRVLVKNAESVRESDAGYSYTAQELEDDVNDALWNVAVRAMDYFGITIDSEFVQSSIEKLGSELIEEIRVQAGIVDGVGKYESLVPGEIPQQTIEVSEKI